MLIAQITDLHIKGDAAPDEKPERSIANFAKTISDLNALAPRPDIVLITGDITENGKIEGYRLFLHELKRLEIPYRLITGNHDEYDSFCEILGGPDQSDDTAPFIQHDTNEYPVRLIGIDTTKPGHVSGELCQQRLDWLEQKLQEDTEKPTAIFMHHPPFNTGIWWMDCLGILQGLDAFTEILMRHQQVKAIFCGHVHRNIQSSLAGVPIFLAPSVTTAVELSLGHEAPPTFISEPPAYLLHVWTGKTFVTHLQYIGRNDVVTDLLPGMPNWPVRLDLMRRGQPIPKYLGDHLYQKERV